MTSSTERQLGEVQASLQKEIGIWFGRIEDSEAYFDLYAEGLDFLSRLLDQKGLPQDQEDSFSHLIEEIRTSPGKVQSAYFAGRKGSFRPRRTYYRELREKMDIVKRVDPMLGQPGLVFPAFADSNSERTKALEKALQTEGIDHSHFLTPFIYANLVVNQAKAGMLEPIQAQIRKLLQPGITIVIDDKKGYLENLLWGPEYDRGFAEVGNKTLWNYAGEVFGDDYQEITFLWRTAIFINPRALPPGTSLTEFYRWLFHPLIQRNYEEAFEVEQALVSQFPQVFPGWFRKSYSLEEGPELEKCRDSLERTQQEVGRGKMVKKDQVHLESLATVQAMIGQTGKTSTGYTFQIEGIRIIRGRERLTLRFLDLPQVENQISVIHLLPTTFLKRLEKGQYFFPTSENSSD